MGRFLKQVISSKICCVKHYVALGAVDPLETFYNKKFCNGKMYPICSTKAIKERDDKERSGKEKKEKKEKTPGSTPETKAENRREKQRDERTGKEERAAREGKEKTPKADREKVKAEEKSIKDDKAKAGNGEPAEPSREREVIKESKNKEKGDRSAVAGTLKSPVPRSESAETERGKMPLWLSLTLI